MNASETADPGLLALAQDFREALRHSIYLVRRLDADGELSAAQLSTAQDADGRRTRDRRRWFLRRRSAGG